MGAALSKRAVVVRGAPACYVTWPAVAVSAPHAIAYGHLYEARDDPTAFRSHCKELFGDGIDPAQVRALWDRLLGAHAEELPSASDRAELAHLMRCLRHQMVATWEHRCVPRASRARARAVCWRVCMCAVVCSRRNLMWLVFDSFHSLRDATRLALCNVDAPLPDEGFLAVSVRLRRGVVILRSFGESNPVCVTFRGI